MLRAGLKDWEKKLSHCHFVRHKSQRWHDTAAERQELLLTAIPFLSNAESFL
jgi:hypothetical protein